MDGLATLDVNKQIEGAPRVAPYVVDADAHVNPAPLMWADYLSPQYRDRAPRLEEGDECDFVVFEGNRKKLMMGSQVGRSRDQFRAFGKLSQVRLSNTMADKRLVDMDADGIDLAVIYGGGPLGTADHDLYIDSFGAYNRWVSDFCAHDPKRLRPIHYVPTTDTRIAATMLAEAGRAGAVGVNLPAFPMSRDTLNKGAAQAIALTGSPAGSRQYRDAEFDALWAAACEADIPITFHLGGRVSRFGDKVNFLPDMPMARVTMLEVVAILIYGGVFDRFPDLRVGLIESGVGWMPWGAEFMDRSWEMQREWNEPLNAHPPSYYFDNNIYGSFVSDAVGVALRHHPGCKNIMWSSDYPHNETTFPNSHATIASNFKGVPDAERDWIIRGCAERFYSL
ncbi:MAG TPA: amidohydrolase family protein [Novosphingobium sp.]|nr:amidohydrolase family protein [Novosphingobium sp.]